MKPADAPSGLRAVPPPVVSRKKVETPSLLPDPEPPKAPAQRKPGTFTLPPLALLDAPKVEQKIDERELMDLAHQLEVKCSEFSVDGQVAQIHPGPVVTTFEFKPEAGVKYSKITGLADDLCLAMKAESVLIDRIPGKSTVGIQIPNPNREPISLRELLESEAYQRLPSKLTLALGKTIHGEPYYADLATMPHLLIAGCTGTGKSVCLNAMLTSILYRATPDDVRMIMIDPKRLELGMYDEIPHLMTPVVMDPKKADALRWAVGEMEERYETLAAEACGTSISTTEHPLGARGGARRAGSGSAQAPALHRHRDRRAGRPDDGGEQRGRGVDLSAGAEVARGRHSPDPRHAAAHGGRDHRPHQVQPARAHLLPGVVEDRLAHVLDEKGAEQLLGKGDMLFLPPASARHIRLHGPYISEQESARLASFLRKQGKPVFDESITAEDEASALDGLELEKDELYDQAARIVVETRQASISYLQRKMRIGFSRAARLVDMMEVEGLVSPSVGGKPREVLVPPNYFDEIDDHPR